MSATDDIITKLEQALENLVALEIVTRVGAAQGGSTKAESATSPDTGSKAIVTRIDLLQGDITTEIDPAFVTGDYKALWDFHATREKQGVDIIKANVAAIEKLLKVLADASA